MLENYEIANLIPLLETIRKPGRYAGLKGVNALTNAALGGTYDKAEVIRELRRAVDAGRRNDHTLNEAGYDPQHIVSWKAHPSRVFHPSRFVKEDFWFRGQDYFKT